MKNSNKTRNRNESDPKLPMNYQILSMTKNYQILSKLKKSSDKSNDKFSTKTTSFYNDKYFQSNIPKISLPTTDKPIETKNIINLRSSKIENFEFTKGTKSLAKEENQLVNNDGRKSSNFLSVLRLSEGKLGKCKSQINICEIGEKNIKNFEKNNNIYDDDSPKHFHRKSRIIPTETQVNFILKNHVLSDFGTNISSRLSLYASKLADSTKRVFKLKKDDSYEQERRSLLNKFKNRTKSHDNIADIILNISNKEYEEINNHNNPQFISHSNLERFIRVRSINKLKIDKEVFMKFDKKDKKSKENDINQLKRINRILKNSNLLKNKFKIGTIEKYKCISGNYFGGSKRMENFT